jgi:hypothetical protein
LCGGEGGIRTHGTVKPYTGFRIRRIRPLCHLSAAGAKSSKLTAIPRAPRSDILATQQNHRGDSYALDALIYLNYKAWMPVAFHALAIFFIAKSAISLRAALPKSA